MRHAGVKPRQPAPTSVLFAKPQVCCLLLLYWITDLFPTVDRDSWRAGTVS